MKQLATFLFLFSFSNSARSAEIDAKALDAIVSTGLKQFEVPGAAVVIVRDGQVVYLKGHGVRALGGETAVTPDTLFAIASCSKAFCSAVIGMFADEGKMAWDDPVRKHIDFFHLQDPLADRDCMIRDLLCHRTGLSRHDPLRYRAIWSDEEKIRRMAELKPATPFRTHWEYNNLGFMVAGYAAASVEKSSYADLLKKRIFEPLGMKTATGSAKVAGESSDVAMPHVRQQAGKVIAIPRYMQEVDGAGGINASARDLGNWLRFHLGDGTFEGKRLISAKNLNEMHSPQMVIQPTTQVGSNGTEGVTNLRTYGLGWSVQDYRGLLSVGHGGAIDGFRTQVLMFPKQKLGIAVVCNLNATSFPDAVADTLADQLLGLPVRDWNAQLFKSMTQREVANEKALAKFKNERKTDTKPSLPLADFAGTWKAPAYGEAKVSMKDDALVLNWGADTLGLEHYHFNTFSIKNPPLDYLGAFTKELITFRLDDKGKPDGMTFLSQEFRRIKK